MDQNNKSPSIYLAASTPEPRNPRLAREAAAMLADCRAMLVECGQAETVKLLDIVILQLNMQLQGISQAELNALTAALANASVDPRLRDADQ